MATAQAIVDHEQIRQWAEARGARPACVKGTGGSNDPGMIRLDFPGYTGAESLQKISWREWFRQFDENDLALLVQDTTSRGQRSNFNKLVRRGTAAARGGRARGASRGQASTRATRAGAASSSGQRKSSGKAAGRSSGSRKAGRTASARKPSTATKSRKSSGSAKSRKRSAAK
jgi:hypothetical protein